MHVFQVVLLTLKRQELAKRSRLVSSLLPKECTNGLTFGTRVATTVRMFCCYGLTSIGISFFDGLFSVQQICCYTIPCDNNCHNLTKTTNPIFMALNSVEKVGMSNALEVVSQC